MLRQGLSGISKKFLQAAVLFSSMAAVLASQDAAAACRGAWAEGNTYNAGDGVTYNGGSYKALVTHTAYVGTGWNPASATTLWTTGGDCGGGDPQQPPPPPPPPPGGSGLGAIISEATFNAMFPNRLPFYTYQGMLAAAAKWPTFAGTGDSDMRKREAAAFLANLAHESGHFRFIEEQENRQPMCENWSGDPDCNGCPAGKWYYGRGPIQLSWSGNYCKAGKALGYGTQLMYNPEMVANDATIAWGTAFWFWMTQTGAQGSTSTSHDCIVNNRGFGCTIRSINGAVECDGKEPVRVQSRINYYRDYAGRFGVSTGTTDTGC